MDQATNPFGQQDTVAIQKISNGQAAAVSLIRLPFFRHDNENAVPNLLQASSVPIEAAATVERLRSLV